MRKAIEPGSPVSRQDIVDSNPAAIGTGFFITADGYLLTNNHVIKDGSQARLVIGSKIISAKVIQVDKVNDIALLKSEGNFLVLPVASSSADKYG